jgi:hypothetical protein
MRRAKHEGRKIGRRPTAIDRATGISLTEVARKHAVSRVLVSRICKVSAS